MNKTVRIILLIGVLLAINILILVGLTDYLGHRATAPLSKPPDHGTTFIIEADFSQMPGDTNMALLEQALQKRLAGMDTHAFMEPASASQLRMMLPVTDSNIIEKIRDNILRRGALEFRLVNDQSDEILANHLPIPPGYEVIPSLEMQPGQQSPESLVVRKQAEDGLAGNFVQSAWTITGNLGNPQIEFRLNQDAAVRFNQVTTKYSPDKTRGTYHRLAIILDGRLYSAPRIIDPIVDGSCEIDGNFTEDDTRRMAQLITDPLPAPIKIVQTNSF